MKRIRLYMMAALLAIAGFFATSTSAQVLRDADFNSIGRINGNGVVRDATGQFMTPTVHASATSTPMAQCMMVKVTCWATSASTMAR